MEHSLSTFDNFSPRLEEIRKEVIANGFTTIKHKDGLEYKGIGTGQYPEFFHLMAEATNHRIIPHLSCFRLSLKGEMPHSLIHSDQVEAKYAAVLYMNPEPSFGGTAFFRHKDTGLYGMPTREELRAARTPIRKFSKSIEADCKDFDKWHFSGLSGARWNRLIIYRANLWHSRFPFEAFGDTPETGRLIWVAFFDMWPKGLKLPAGIKLAKPKRA